jgi:hypothetical protein
MMMAITTRAVTTSLHEVSTSIVFPFPHLSSFRSLSLFRSPPVASAITEPALSGSALDRKKYWYAEK